MMADREQLKYIYTKTSKRKDLPNQDGTITDEFAITLTQESAAELARALDTVVNTNGELGARVVLYTSMRSNKQTGEKFPSTSILVQAKQPAPARGSFARGGGGGRRQYPTQTPPTREGYQARPPTGGSGWQNKTPAAPKPAPRQNSGPPTPGPTTGPGDDIGF